MRIVPHPVGGRPSYRQLGSDRGITKEARTVRMAILEVERSAWRTEQTHVWRQRELALHQAFRDCSESDWDGYGAAPANALSMAWASKVLSAFPDHLGVPEIAFEPDGDVGLEWWQGAARVLAVSVGRNGDLRYATRLNAATVIGTEVFADGLPDRLVKAACEVVELSGRAGRR